MTRRPTLLLAAALCLAPPGAGAHPHIFIDAGVHPLFDNAGRLAAVRVIWTYDEYYSLLVLEDLGLDADYDGLLSDAEKRRLDGFDMKWLPDYAGDLYVLSGGQEVGLSRPVEHSADMVDGRIVTTHTRALDERIAVAEDPVVFRIYDPTFYTAYHVALPTVIEGRTGCKAATVVPDLDAANQALKEALAELGTDESTVEMGFPEVGSVFAEEIHLTCAPSS